MQRTTNFPTTNELRLYKRRLRKKSISLFGRSHHFFTFEQHLEDLRKVFELMKKAKLEGLSTRKNPRTPSDFFEKIKKIKKNQKNQKSKKFIKFPKYIYIVK